MTNGGGASGSALPGAPWRTLANAVSGARLALAPVSVHAILTGRWALAAGVFVAAVASDLADGPLARRRGTASALGGVLDHSADAVFVAVTLWALAYAEAQRGADLVPGILPLFIVLAFAQYLLDSRALRGQPLRGSWLGRANGVAYFVLAGTVIGREALAWHWIWAEAIYIAGLAVVVSTLTSMALRLRALVKREDDGFRGS